MNNIAVKAVHVLTRAENRNLIPGIEPVDIRHMLYANIVRLASNYVTEQYNSNDEIDIALGQQWTAYRLGMARFMYSADEQRLANNSSLSIYQYWCDRLYHKDTELLATISIAMLSINPSEASVERSFSAQKLVHTLLRNRLHDDIVEAQMFIKINGPLLTSSIEDWLSQAPDQWTIIDNEHTIEEVLE